MAKKRFLSDSEKGQIRAFKEEGLSNREIARRIGRSSTVVDNFVTKGDEYGKKKSSGRPAVLSPRTKRLIRAAAVNSTKGTRRLQRELAPNNSHMTVWRVLNESTNLQYEKMKPVPRLSKQHKLIRAEFADEHQTWTAEWDTVK